MSDLLKAIEFQQAGKIEEAAKLFLRVLANAPMDGAALYSLGVIELNSGRPAEALKYGERGVKAAPAYAPMWFLLGSACQGVGNHEKALAHYDRALQVQPDFVEVLINSGVMLRDLFRHKEALERFNQVLATQPDNLTALANCGILLTEFKESQLAIGMFSRLLALKPDYDYGFGLLIYERLHIGDWTDFEPLRQTILQGIREGKRVCKTLAFMALSGEAWEHYLCARIFANQFAPRQARPLWQGEVYSHEKLRIAYVSPDFREHPVGHAIAGMFEQHDKSRFEVHAYSLGIDDGSSLRKRFEKAADKFVDARMMTAMQIAQQIRDAEIDVLVDLAGYTADSRIAVFAHRPAPVQVNYLGYPGTLGVGYMDYIVADPTIIPENHRPFYAEEVAYLPDTYFPYDAGIKIPEELPTRSQYGLPEQGVVFCSFSHDYKISPPLWAVWMRLLEKVPGSVLWLVSRNPPSRENFRLHAQEAGIDPDRLIFAERVPRIEDHLSRYRLADVFLDTWPYNAHTTAADALYAGVPVVAMLGNAFPARVAASLLRALGIEDLITESSDAYEALALKLGQDENFRSAICHKIASNRAQMAMFDTNRFTRNWENLMVGIHDRKKSL
jgi:protein O-GlcNAc transferase